MPHVPVGLSLCRACPVSMRIASASPLAMVGSIEHINAGSKDMAYFSNASLYPACLSCIRRQPMLGPVIIPIRLYPSPMRYSVISRAALRLSKPTWWRLESEGVAHIVTQGMPLRSSSRICHSRPGVKSTISAALKLLRALPVKGKRKTLNKTLRMLKGGILEALSKGYDRMEIRKTIGTADVVISATSFNDFLAGQSGAGDLKNTTVENGNEPNAKRKKEKGRTETVAVADYSFQVRPGAAFFINSIFCGTTFPGPV